MLILILSDLYGPNNDAWPMFRHDYKRTGYYRRLSANCTFLTHLYDVVHGTLDESVVSRDANGDGYADVIGTQESYYGVKTFHGHTGGVLWSMGSDQFGSPPPAAAVSDVRVFANAVGYFYVMNLYDGSVIYNYDKPNRRDPSPALTDMNSDGCPEVFTAFGSQAVAIDGCESSYTTLWTASLPANAHAPALGDVNGDGDLEVLYPMTNGDIKILDAWTGATLWTIASAGVPSSPYYPDYTVALDDIDGDGRDEVVVATDVNIKVYDYTTTWAVLWSRSPASSVPALGDKDGDGLSDVWVVQGGNLYVYRGTDGSPLGNTTWGDLTNHRPPSLVDLTGDRVPEALVIRSGYYVRVINGITMAQVGVYGSTPYTITSEVIVLKLNDKLGFSVGDFSCHINTWGECPLGNGGGGDLTIGERDALPSFSFNGKYVLVNAPSGSMLEVYDRLGSRVMSVKVSGFRKVDLTGLPAGIYFVLFNGTTRRIVIR